MPESSFLEGNRKLFALVFFLIMAVGASYLGALNEQLIAVFSMAAAGFFGANSVEWVSKAIVTAKSPPKPNP